MWRIRWLVALASVLVAISAYNSRDEILHLLQGSSGPPTAAASVLGQSAPGAAVRAEANRSPPLFTVATVVATTGDLPDQRQTIGWIFADSTNLTSQTSGIVSELVARQGSEVKEGDVLVRLDRRTADAAVAKDQATIQRDQASLDLAKHIAANTQALAQKGVDTQNDVQTAQTAVAVAAATVGVDNAQLAADQVTQSLTQIRAPYDGRIGAFQVTAGSLIQPGTQVVTLTRMAPVYASFALSENDLSALRDAMGNGVAKVTATPTAPGTNGATGKVTFLDSTMDKASGTVQVRGEFANTDQALWPGELVDITLDLGPQTGLVLVPTAAVVAEPAGSVVYVVKPDHTIDIRHVQVVVSNSDLTGLSAGLQAGDHVVVEGQFNLTSGQRVDEVAESPSAAAAGTTAPAPQG